MSNINIELKGYTADIIDKMVADGYAKTKTEAIRLALFEFDQIHKLTEEELYAKAAQKILRDIKTGKEKTSRYTMKIPA
jgi:Arc/MetJ-type ribon-helix-helix transcriptional regulator